MDNSRKKDVVRDYLSVLLEEIALEGLDGITLEVLWIRLSNNSSWSLKPLDDNIKDFVWRKLLLLEEVRWYDIKTPRKCPIIFNSFDDFLAEIERNNVDPTKLSAENYPHRLIHDGDIIGSCPSYDERIDISDEIQKLSFSKANEKYSNRLVIVADQEIRNHVLLAGRINPEVELPDISYCILERIGRGRTAGELSVGLNFLKNGANPTFYFWNKLRKLKLITAQIVTVSSKLTSCTLLYLPNFHKSYITEVMSTVSYVIDFIQSKPNKLVPLIDLYPLLPEEKRKVIKSDFFRRYIKLEVVPYVECYPDSSPTECHTKNGATKVIRIAKLINENVDARSVLRTTDVEDHEEKLSGILKGSRFLNRPIIAQCYNAINFKQEEGITMLELGLHLGLNKLMARLLIKSLLKLNLISCIALDNGRQRYFRYYSKRYENAVEKNLKEQIGKPFFEEQKPKNNVPEQLENIQIKPETTSEDESKKRKFEAEVDDEPKITKKPRKLPKKTNPTNLSSISALIPPGETVHFVRRLNIVLEYVYKNEVVISSNLVKVIRDEEVRLGVSRGTPCSRPIKRIIKFLVENNKLVEFKKKIVEERLNKNREITFICAPDVTEDHPIIQTAIADVKKNLAILYLKPSLLSKCTKKKLQEMKLDLFKLSRSNETDLKYGFVPKFARMRILHEFLIYLVYAYEGNETLNDDDNLKYIKSYCSEFNENEEIPKCYVREISFKMFIPPFSKYEEYGDGWISMNEIVERIPLKMLFSLVRLSYEVPGIEAYLKHPVKQFYLMRHLSYDAKSLITADKKYQLSILGDIKNLCMIGLAQLGPKISVLGNMNLIYLNKTTELLDTRICPPSYLRTVQNLSYDKYTYNFTIPKIVDNYWNDASRFSIGTRLSQKKSATVIKQKRKLKAELIPYVTEKNVEEVIANDNGQVPGDRLGAAGYDSSLFAHFIKQWFISNAEKSIPTNFVPKTKPKISKLKDTTQLKRMRLNLHKKKSKRCRESYDMKDIEALKKMRTLRAQWSKSEDEILLMLYVASQYYIPKNLSSYSPAILFRKILHEKSEISASKTSHSCRRRVKCMVKNPFRRHNLDLFLKELRHDSKLQKEVENDIKKIDACAKEKDKSTQLLSLMDKLTEHVFNYLYENTKLKVGLIGKENTEFVLPSTIEDFREKYTFEYPVKNRKKAHLPLETEGDIVMHVLNSLIYSAMFSQIDKTKSINVNYLYQIFKRFDDRYLKNALTFVRVNRLISVNKYGERFKGSLLPLGKGSYHFSQTFHIILKSLCNMSLINTIYRSYLEVIGKHEIDCYEKNFNDIGINLFLIAYLSHEKVKVNVSIPENIMFFNADSTSEIDPEKIVKPMFDNIKNHSKQTLSLVRETFFNNNSADKIKIDESDEDSTEEKENVSKDDEELFDDSSESDSDDELSAEVQEKLKETLGPRSRMAVFLTRIQFKHSFIRFSNAYDHFFINKFPIKFDFDPTTPCIEVVAEGFNPTLCRKIEKNSSYKTIKYTSLELGEIVRKNFDLPRDRDFALRILEFLQVKGKNGATTCVIADEFTDLNSLNRIIRVLCDKKVVLQSGTRYTHYIHIDFAHHWLIPCWPSVNIFHVENPSKSAVVPRNKVISDNRENLSDKNQIWLAVKPWIQINGTINRPALNSLLIKILSYVIKNTGLSLESLQYRFEPALLSHWTRELVEFLLEIKAVKFYMYEVPKCSLLSKKSELTISENVTGFENESSIFIEADVNCLTKLSLFIGTANYEDLLEIKYPSGINV